MVKKIGLNLIIILMIYPIIFFLISSFRFQKEKVRLRDETAQYLLFEKLFILETEIERAKMKFSNYSIDALSGKKEWQIIAKNDPLIDNYYHINRSLELVDSFYSNNLYIEELKKVILENQTTSDYLLVQNFTNTTPKLFFVIPITEINNLGAIIFEINFEYLLSIIANGVDLDLYNSKYQIVYSTNIDRYNTLQINMRTERMLDGYRETFFDEEGLHGIGFVNGSDHQLFLDIRIPDNLYIGAYSGFLVTGVLILMLFLISAIIFSWYFSVWFRRYSENIIISKTSKKDLRYFPRMEENIDSIIELIGIEDELKNRLAYLKKDMNRFSSQVKNEKDNK